MPNIFKVQGFGALSEWNGQFSSASADQAFQAMASLGSNSIALTTRIWTDSRTGNDVLAVPDKTESDASLLAGFQKAHAAGLDVVFKPGITGLDGTISHSLAPSDVDAFFASYKAEIVHLAERLGRSAPVNATLVALVHAAEQGGRRRWSGHELLAAVEQAAQK